MTDVPVKLALPIIEVINDEEFSCV